MDFSSSYVNSLYVYPQAVDLSAVSGARNLLVEVRLLGHDHAPLPLGKQAAAAASLCVFVAPDGKHLSRCGRTTISIGTKRPAFSDELEVQKKYQYSSISFFFF